MARTCYFCERWFRNKQAVRRHLGYCKAYQSGEKDSVRTSPGPARSERNSLCADCGCAQRSAGRCEECGSGDSIDEDLLPIRCHKCGKLTPTASAHWDGYCSNARCGWPLSEEAQLRALDQQGIARPGS